MDESTTLVFFPYNNHFLESSITNCLLEVTNHFFMSGSLIEYIYHVKMYGSR